MAIGGGLICVYNATRFGSPTEFGTSYQLTVSDITRMEYTHRLLERRSTAPYRHPLQEKS